MKIITFGSIGLIILGAVTFVPKPALADPALSATENSPLKKDVRPWTKKMQALYKTLADLLTDVTSDRRFNDPANRQRIENEANKLAALAHDLTKKKMVRPDADPTIQIVAGLLDQETKRAALELKRGNRNYARGILRSIPGYCMTCHMRNASGTQYTQLPFEPTSQSLTPLERGEFFAASRQYDRAQQEFLKVIRDQKTATAYNSKWEQAIQHSLAIAVRVKQDPVQALEVVQTAIDMKGAPLSIRTDAKAWKTQIQEWQAELSRQVTTEEGLYAEALRLIAKAREIQQYPMDRTADVLYLRTASVVHSLLQTPLKGGHEGDALLLAGLSYEVLSPLRGEDLHDLYYETCIRRVPHTPTAEACYNRYEQSIIFSYTGSAGTDVPEQAHRKLSELRALSQSEIQIKN